MTPQGYDPYAVSVPQHGTLDALLSLPTARAQGARVLITEIDPICALQAAIEGYQVVTMEEAAPLGDIFVTTTGCKSALPRAHMDATKRQALVCHIRHLDTDIAADSLLHAESLTCGEGTPRAWGARLAGAGCDEGTCSSGSPPQSPRPSAIAS